MHAFALKRLNRVQSLIIPQPGNSGDWNRYAYVLYNPANFNDPTGHYSGKYNTALEWVDDLGIDLGAQYMRDNLPDYIPTDDEKLFKAYIALYMSTDVFVINPFTGEWSSGYQLALYIARNGITLEWDVKHSQYNGSQLEYYYEHCSRDANACVIKSGTTIYFNPDKNADPLRSIFEIATTLAHETTHFVNGPEFEGSSVLDEYMAVHASLSIDDHTQNPVVNYESPLSVDVADLMDINFLIKGLNDNKHPSYGVKYAQDKMDGYPDGYAPLSLWQKIWSVFGGN